MDNTAKILVEDPHLHRVDPYDNDGTTIATKILFIPEQPDKSAQQDVEQAINSDITASNTTTRITCQIELHFMNHNHNHNHHPHQVILFCLDEHGQRKPLYPTTTTTTSDNDNDSNDYHIDDEEFYIRYEEYMEQDEGQRILRLQAVAVIQSRSIEDGNYILEFVETPMSPSSSTSPQNQYQYLQNQNQQQPHGLGNTQCSIDEEDNTTNDVDKAIVDNNIASTKVAVVGILTVYLEYSNGIGRMPPPTKNTWDHGGYTHKTYTYTFPKYLYYNEQRQEVNGDDYIDNNNDYQRPFRIKKFHPPPLTHDTNLRNYQRVFLFGDSTFCQFCRQRPNIKGKYYFQHNMRVGEKVRIGLNTNTVSELIDLLHEQLGRWLCGIDDSTLSTPIIKNNKTALIVGSCLWDILDSNDTIQGREYNDHAIACRQYIINLRQRYPNITIIWKSPMAVHIHWVDLNRVVEHDKSTATLFGRDRIRYMSRSRSKYLYVLQKQIMKEMNVPFLDLYQSTYLSSDWLYPSDGRHYRPDFNRFMLSWFYPPFYPPLQLESKNDDDRKDENQDQGQDQVVQQKYYQQVV